MEIEDVHINESSYIWLKDDESDHQEHHQEQPPEFMSVVSAVSRATKIYYQRHWVLAICVIGFILLEALSITRTSLLVAQSTTHTLDWSECEYESNSTDQDTSDDENERYLHIAKLLYIVNSLLHWMEYAFLAYGTCKMVAAVQLWDDASKEKIRKVMKENYCRCHNVAATVVMTIFVTASLAVPVLSIVEAYNERKDYPDCDQQEQNLLIHCVYQSLTILAHFVSPGIRIFMAVMVLAVQGIWVHEHTLLWEERIPVSSDDTETSEDWKHVSCEFYDCVLDYELRQRKIKTVLGVFRSWFVIQWFIYYFQFLVDLTQVIRPFYGEGVVLTLAHIHRMVYVFYDFLAFFIPHVCGVRMNHHHDRYLKHLRGRLLDDARKRGTKMSYAIAGTLHFDKHPHCDFVPTVPYTGINIPLDSAGYVMGILLTIFAWIGAFIVL